MCIVHLIIKMDGGCFSFPKSLAWERESIIRNFIHQYINEPMHELTAVRNILSLASDIIHEEGKKATLVFVIIGEFAIITPSQFSELRELLTKEFISLKDVKFSLESRKGYYKCLNCGITTDISHSIVRTGFHDIPMIISCKKCQSTDLELMQGTDIYIDHIEFVDN